MREWLKYVGFIALCTLWATLCFVVPDFLDNPTDGWKNILTLCVYVTAIGVMNFMWLYLSGLHKHLFAVFLPIYSLLGSVVAYYRVAYHATVTPMIIEVTLHTNAGTVAGVVSWQLISYILLNLAIAALFIIRRYRSIRPVKPLWQAVVVILLIPVYYNFNSRLHTSLNQRYPMNIYHSIAEFARFHHSAQSERELTPVIQVTATDSLDVIVIIGEALRADHLSLNGYERMTTPRLQNRSQVISLPHIYSQHTYTSASVPHILTPADSSTVEKAYTHHSFIQNFAEQGYTTAWLSNQDIGHTYAAFINEADTSVFPNASKTVFVYTQWTDMELLPYLDRQISLNASHNLYILHSIGSHWYYNLHIPDSLQQFMPITTNRIVTSNTQEQIVNSYDNTVLCFDAFTDSVIQRFENRTAILFYLSDHGESLGEDGNYLHAAGAEETKYPAALVWYSDRYAQLFPEKIAAIRTNSRRHYRTDYLFYSVLSAAGMEVDGYEGGLDICREEL